VLAPHLDAVVAAYPNVKIGSYPRFSERDFRVLVTFESSDSEAVAGAFDALVGRLGDAVVRSEAPARVGSLRT
jgi:molybdopterin-biosynthesis enzyme MoeA-like protein